jgi:hypothetical protein
LESDLPPVGEKISYTGLEDDRVLLWSSHEPFPTVDCATKSMGRDARVKSNRDRFRLIFRSDMNAECRLQQKYH